MYKPLVVLCNIQSDLPLVHAKHAYRNPRKVVMIAEIVMYHLI